MPRYDPDRIADLAAGSLDPAEAAALEAAIAADPQAAAELAAQRMALEAIRRAPVPILAADERAELRRAVAAALNLEAAPEAAAAPARRRVPWGAVAVAAAALAAIVAVVPLIGLLSVGGGDEGATTVALAVTTTAVGGAFESAPGDLGPNPTIAASGGAPSDGTTYILRSVNKAAEAIEGFLADPASLFATPAPGQPACAAEARVVLGETARPSGAKVPLGDEESLDETSGVVWFVSGDGVTVQRLAVLDPATCDLLAAHP